MGNRPDLLDPALTRPGRMDPLHHSSSFSSNSRQSLRVHCCWSWVGYCGTPQDTGRMEEESPPWYWFTFERGGKDCVDVFKVDEDVFHCFVIRNDRMIFGSCILLL